MRALRWILICALVLLMGGPVVAAERGGVHMPDSTTLDGKRLVLNGLGIREATILKVDVYVAGLYLEHKSSDAGAILRSKQRKVLQMKFVRDVDRSDIVEAWQEGFAKNTPDAKKLAPKIKQLQGYMRDMAEGQTMTFSYVPGKGVTVRVNGKTMGRITGHDFQAGLYANFIGPHPPNEGLKQGLLGKG